MHAIKIPVRRILDEAFLIRPGFQGFGQPEGINAALVSPSCSNIAGRLPMHRHLLYMIGHMTPYSRLVSEVRNDPNGPQKSYITEPPSYDTSGLLAGARPLNESLVEQHAMKANSASIPASEVSEHGRSS